MAGANQGYDVCNDTIFVTGLPGDTTDDQLADYFGQIGIIKFDKKNDCKKIWIYKDKATGKGKGEATITYDDPPTATSAIQWFDGKEFRGSTLKIELAQRKSAPQYSRGGGGFRGGHRGDGGGGGGRGGGGFDRGAGSGVGGGGGGRGNPGRPGDWACPSCSNNNFAYRQECNRCKTPKPAGAGGGSASNDGGGGGRSGGSHYNGGSRQHGGDNYSRNGGSGGGSGGYRDRYRDRDGGGRDGGRDRDSGRDGGRGHYAAGGGGPSRSHMQRGRDDRRQRPY